jgi:hypothetical protein
MEEGVLFFRSTSTTTTGEDIFKIENSYFSRGGLNWYQCFSVSTSGAPAILVAHQGFCARVNKINPQVKIFHCFLHRKNLAPKRLPPELETMMNDIIQIVNFIKKASHNSRIFSQM